MAVKQGLGHLHVVLWTIQEVDHKFAVLNILHRTKVNLSEKCRLLGPPDCVFPREQQTLHLKIIETKNFGSKIFDISRKKKYLS